MTTHDLRVLQCLGDKSKVLLFWNRKLYTINQFLSGVRNRQFWMHWILQQFCQDDEDSDEEEPQKVAPKPAVAKPAAAEAAESGDVL